MVFHSVNKSIPQLNISMGQVLIEKVNSFIFLGVTLDPCLSWKAHINNLSLKVSRNCGVLNKLKHFLPKDVLILLYNSLIMSHITYGISTWGYADTTERIHKIQKRAIRIITCSKFNAHTNPIFKSLKLLKLDDLRMLNEFKFYFKFVNQSLPYYNMTMVNEMDNSNKHYYTRTMYLLQPITHRLKLAKKKKISLINTINNARMMHVW